MQRMTVELSIPIPAESVIISKVEYNELQNSELTGVYWTIQDLEERVGKGSIWIKENILYQPRLKELLDCEKGGFVFYPKVKGQSWSFQASKMAEFFETYFTIIFKGEKANESYSKQK